MVENELGDRRVERIVIIMIVGAFQREGWCVQEREDITHKIWIQSEYCSHIDRKVKS